MFKNKQITIKGRVQGVGFRFHALETAKKNAIKGYARNMPDGTVFIEAEGEEEDLEKFISWCKTGPAYAKVENVKILEGKISNFREFSIQ